MRDDFKTFMSQLQETNQSLDFFCDFEKIHSNVLKIKIKLCTLNALLGTTDLRAAVQAVWDESPNAFEVLPILIAVRDKETWVRLSLEEYKKMQDKNPIAGVMVGLLEEQIGQKRKAITTLDNFAMSEPDLIITPAVKNHIKELVK